jgi:AraC-like DNA-binding protein/mannose-6-phosphate isomerase-like protein (cupin superfamily)
VKEKLMINPQTPVFVSTMDSDRFEVFHSYIPVEEGLRLHTHDHYEINCILDGSSIFYIDGKEYESSPGTVFLISPGAIHNVVKETSLRYERIYLHINKEYLASRSTPNTDLTSCFRSYEKPANRVISSEPLRLRKFLDPLLHLPTQDYGSDMHYEQRFLDFMLMINEAVLGNGKNTVLENKASERPRLITDVVRYVDEHLAGDLSLDTIATQCFVNKYYLSREFKKEMGLNLSRFILLRRLQYSKWLLPRRESAKKVYRSCGFKSYTHFLRCFQNEFHMTTTEYLEKVRKPTTLPR